MIKQIHKQVLVPVTKGLPEEFGGEVYVDEKLVDIIECFFYMNTRTNNSCQSQKGYVWLGWDIDDFTKLMSIAVDHDAHVNNHEIITFWKFIQSIDKTLTYYETWTDNPDGSSTRHGKIGLPYVSIRFETDKLQSFKAMLFEMANFNAKKTTEYE